MATLSLAPYTKITRPSGITELHARECWCALCGMERIKTAAMLARLGGRPLPWQMIELGGAK
jgi:hypothetical protein